ncbi:MAG: XRE family transcriptional regulator [Deltaproteobacteria bacterium]|nr:XRE family transcriptional regulator [Deltaproteobacteria bacterium]
MNCRDFHLLRQRFGKTQKQMGELLGASLKAIQSFEQGWRKIPVHIERQMFFLQTMREGLTKNQKPCWEIRNCSVEARRSCPAWEFRVGQLCWFINGTICQGEPEESWKKKMKVCQKCEVFFEAVKPHHLGDWR